MNKYKIIKEKGELSILAQKLRENGENYAADTLEKSMGKFNEMQGYIKDLEDEECRCCKINEINKNIKEYLDNEGNHCPNCESDDIQADRPHADGGYATSDVKCHTCKATWVDQYKLIGIEELKNG